MKALLRIKPHHFLDIIRDFGAGVHHKPHPYGHAVHEAARLLRENPRTLLELTSGADEICQPCRFLKHGRCTDTTTTPGRKVRKGSWNRLIDCRIFKRLGLREGDRIPAVDFCRLAEQRLGDLFTLYREADPRKTALREKNLRKGIEQYLKRDAVENR